MNSQVSPAKLEKPPLTESPQQEVIGSKEKSKNEQAPSENTTFLQRASNCITGNLENAFDTLGGSIGLYPWRFIIGAVTVCLLCGLGMVNFSEVTDPDRLWVPEGSQVLEDKDWIDTNYNDTVAREVILAVSTNILTPTGLQALLDIYQNSLTLNTTSGTSLTNVCITSGSDCMVLGILEVWSYNAATIGALTQQQIVDDVNSVTTSPIYGSDITLSNYLGGITYDSASNNVTGAAAAVMIWMTEKTTALDDWELEFIRMGLGGHSDLSSTYVFASRSWKDETGKSIQNDIKLLTIGYVLVVFFVVLVLGKFNFLEQKAWLTLAGFLCIGFAILVAVGVSSAMHQQYGPIQSILPFLLLGIGVDDMFVIMGAYNSLTADVKGMDIPYKMGKVLRKAGVSITVTSVTDCIAFLIGSTTVIPAMRSFCIYAGIGIVALFLLQAIFFTSCLSLDLRRLDDRRDACCMMIIRSPDYKPNECSERQIVPLVFRRGLARLVTFWPVKILATMVTLAVFSVNVYGLIQLRQYFDGKKYLPSDSYAYTYAVANDYYFPNDGDIGYVYCGTINYWSHKSEMESLNSAMNSSAYIQSSSLDSWFLALTNWLSSTSDASVTSLLDANDYPQNQGYFVALAYNLTTVQATRTSSYIKFNTGNTEILASRFPFKHIPINDASTQIKAMEDTRAFVANLGISTDRCFPYSDAYRTWETNKVIREELYRNLGIATACVFVVTLLLIANLLTSVIVFFGVAFTLVDVAGTMYFWGLTIETVTSIVLITSIGLAVDYSAHIGHTFMTVSGTRNERARETVAQMGPPVFYGGFSTFLAFILLSTSSSYVFQTFFKVNFLVVLYGLFHGIVFLPVLLSWLGPDPYPTAEARSQSKNDEQKGNAKDQDHPVFTTNDAGHYVDKTDKQFSYQDEFPGYTKVEEMAPPPSHVQSEGLFNRLSSPWSGEPRPLSPPRLTGVKAHFPANDTPPPLYQNTASRGDVGGSMTDVNVM